MNIFKKSMLSGLVNFFPVFFILLFTTTDQLPMFSIGGLFLLGYTILPGLVFSLLLITHVKSQNKLLSFLFGLLATATYCCLAYVASGISFITKKQEWAILLSSVVGFQLLLLLYFYLIDNKIQVIKAITIGFLLSIACAILPFIGILCAEKMDGLKMLFIFSIFFTWQSCFGLVVYYTRTTS